ncbi:MAG TPA: M1 family aminopeptidase [Planctomycetota bacterium]|jgi:hypothetical protein|nr:M1 family aminopeptidase [Planctomycetota bacterium]
MLTFQFLCVAAMLAPSCRAPGQEVVDSGVGWRMVSLDLDLEFAPADGQMEGRGTAVLELDGASSFGPTIGMNARECLMRFTSVEARPPTDVRINEAYPGVPNARTALVRYPQALAKGARVTLAFVWESTGRDAQFAVTEQAAIASWTEGWYPIPAPSPDQSLAAVASAPGRTRFHLPAGWSSVSNGKRLAAHDEGGVTVEEWEVQPGVARSFAAGPYHVESQVVGEREIAVHLLTKTSTEAHLVADALARALKALEERFGPYPYPSYRIVEVPEKIGSFYASSEMGFIMAESSAFEQPGGNLVLFAHEMAHGWWGNLVSSNGPAGILCSESLAQYSAVVAIEAVDGADAAADFLRFSRTGYSDLQCAAGYFRMARQGHDKPLIELTSGGFDHMLSDAKGHWMYHMLRARVGDDVFFDVLRKLIGTGAEHGLSVEGMRRAFVAAAPNAGLETFFVEWLEHAGAPVVELDWNATIDSGSKPSSTEIEVRLRQVQEGELYHLPIELEITTAAGPCRRTVELDSREGTFVLAAPAHATHVRIDPDDHLMLWRPEYGPRPGAGAPPK